MHKSKDEIKKELSDANVQLKEGIKKVNEDYKIKAEERKNRRKAK